MDSDAKTRSTPRAPAFPLVVYGSSGLGNLFTALPIEQKRAMIAAWLEGGDRPIVIDSAGKYGAGLALECLGTCLRDLGAPAEAVRVGVKLGWLRVPLVGDEPTFEPGAWVGLSHDAEQRIDADGIRACWEQARELLGDPYSPTMVSVHDPDEYLAASADDAEREDRWNDILDAYHELERIASESPGRTIGVGAKDWRAAKRIADAVTLDWVMLANCVTAYTHEPEALEFIADLAKAGTAVINSGVFNAGFLVGGEFFDYRRPSPGRDAAVFRWRDDFNTLCGEHGVEASHACIQFGLSPPGVVSIALNTTSAKRVSRNLEYARTALPDAFWVDAKRRGLVNPDYAHLGVG